MAGDNSLNKTVYSDFEEMKRGLTSDDDVILVLADRYSSNYYEDEWNEARLFEISYENDCVKVLELEDEDIGVSLDWLDDSIDTGSESTLKSFLQYARNHYNSQKIYLDLWNHGGGWKSGDLYTETGVNQDTSRNICSDENSGNSLSLKELNSALTVSGIGHFDIILMDACSMGSVEVAAELLGFTDTVIFSQDTIPENGMPYDEIVPILFSDKTSDEKCVQICDSYTYSYEKQETTISAFRIDEDDSMKEFLMNFEEYISNLSDLNEIMNGRPYYYDFLNEVIDLDIFFNSYLKSDYNDILISNCSDYSSGMSIFFPEFFSYSKDSWEYAPERLCFLKLCPSYIDFLARIQQENSSDLTTDLYEPNNFQIDSYMVMVNQNTKRLLSYLWCTCDEDWYVFDNPKDIHSITLEMPEFIEYNLQVLLYKDGKFINSFYENEVDVSSIDFDQLYVKVYSSFGFYDQSSPYTLEWE